MPTMTPLKIHAQREHVPSFDEYQKFTTTTARYPTEEAIGYLALGLNGEAGEVAEKVKKYIRDDTPFDVFMPAVIKELGDVMWYVAQLAHTFNVDLSTVAALNMDKLQSRVDRDKVHGDGDDR